MRKKPYNLEQSTAKLRELWGGKYSRNMETVKAFIKNYGNEAVKARLKEDVGNSPGLAVKILELANKAEQKITAAQEHVSNTLYPSMEGELVEHVRSELPDQLQTLVNSHRELVLGGREGEPIDGPHLTTKNASQGLSDHTSETAETLYGSQGD